MKTLLILLDNATARPALTLPPLKRVGFSGYPEMTPLNEDCGVQGFRLTGNGKLLALTFPSPEMLPHLVRQIYETLFILLLCIPLHSQTFLMDPRPDPGEELTTRELVMRNYEDVTTAYAQWAAFNEVWQLHIEATSLTLTGGSSLPAQRLKHAFEVLGKTDYDRFLEASVQALSESTSKLAHYHRLLAKNRLDWCQLYNLIASHE